MTHATLTVCMGLPASGKSTWCKVHAGDALVVSADPIRTAKASGRAVFGKMRREAGRALLDGRDVYVDACSLQWRDRQPWLTFASGLGAHTRLVIFDTPKSVCAHRDRARRHPAGRLDVYANRMREALRHVPREAWGVVEFVLHVGTTDPTTKRGGSSGGAG